MDNFGKIEKNIFDRRSISDRILSHTKSGLNNLLLRSKLFALTPNPSPQLGRGEPEPQDLAG
jgi:hypothetical protein